MNIINALSVPFYEFKCDESIIDEIYPIVKDLEYDVKHDKTSLSRDYFYHEKLVSWFDECLEKIREIYFSDGLKLVVANCWATKTGFISNHHPHIHHQAIVGGILYLDDSDNGETIFYADNPWLRYQNQQIMSISDRKMHQLTTRIKQEKGKLILYPPHILHGTSTNKDKKVRHTIAFDVFFSGRITANSNWPYVEIKTTSLKDIHLNNF